MVYTYLWKRVVLAVNAAKAGLSAAVLPTYWSLKPLWTLAVVIDEMERLMARYHMSLKGCRKMILLNRLGSRKKEHDFSIRGHGNGKLGTSIGLAIKTWGTFSQDAVCSHVYNTITKVDVPKVFERYDEMVQINAEFDFAKDALVQVALR
ncbi:hypothetical protein Tco_0520399 [Tanacetum coccineum]